MNTNQEKENRIQILHGDFTSVRDVKAWSCFITQDMSWEGALNQDILAHAGEALDSYVLENILEAKTGEIYCCPAFNAPVDHIILGIIPQWRDGLFDEEQLVARCYKNLCRNLENNEIDSVALPVLGGGKRSFPQRRIARIMMNSLLQNMPETLKSISIVCKDESSFEIYRERLVVR